MPFGGGGGGGAEGGGDLGSFFEDELLLETLQPHLVTVES